MLFNSLLHLPVKFWGFNSQNTISIVNSLMFMQRVEIQSSFQAPHCRKSLSRYVLLPYLIKSNFWSWPASQKSQQHLVKLHSSCLRYGVILWHSIHRTCYINHSLEWHIVLCYDVLNVSLSIWLSYEFVKLKFLPSHASAVPFFFLFLLCLP